jgi:starvation-inducible outer membrane lipoprotein
MKTLLLLSIAFVLAACSNNIKEEHYNTFQASTVPVCMDGVEYWAQSVRNKGYFAVRIDPVTMQPRRCK